MVAKFPGRGHRDLFPLSFWRAWHDAIGQRILQDFALFLEWKRRRVCCHKGRAWWLGADGTPHVLEGELLMAPCRRWPDKPVVVRLMVDAHVLALPPAVRRALRVRSGDATVWVHGRDPDVHFKAGEQLAGWGGWLAEAVVAAERGKPAPAAPVPMVRPPAIAPWWLWSQAAMSATRAFYEEYERSPRGRAPVGAN